MDIDVQPIFKLAHLEGEIILLLEYVWYMCIPARMIDNSFSLSETDLRLVDLHTL